MKHRNKVMMADVSMYLTKSQMADQKKMIEEQKKEEEEQIQQKRQRKTIKNLDANIIIKISDAKLQDDNDENNYTRNDGDNSPFPRNSSLIKDVRNMKKKKEQEQKKAQDRQENVTMTSQKKKRAGWFSK